MIRLISGTHHDLNGSKQDRLAITDNVLEQVYYQDKDQLWYLLDDLRHDFLVTVERKLQAETWAALKQQFGWRPLAQQFKMRKR